jgi:hypothetical protein
MIVRKNTERTKADNGKCDVRDCPEPMKVWFQRNSTVAERYDSADCQFCEEHAREALNEGVAQA